MLPQWRTSVHDAITGDFIAWVNPVAFPWSTSLLNDGSAQVSFQADAADWPYTQSQMEALFRPHTRLLALSWGSFVAYAGKIEDWWWEQDTGRIEVPTVELANEYDWRFTYGLDAYTSGTLTVTNRSASGAVRAILGRFMGLGPYSVYPIDLPADGSGGITETWEFFKKYRIGDLIDQIRQRGYEVYLRPYFFTGNQLRFETRVASAVTLTGGRRFHLQAQDSPLGGVRYRFGAVNQITGLQGVGNGTGEDQEVKYAGDPYTMPIRDVRRDFPDLTGDALQAAVNATYAMEKSPTPQWTIERFQLGEEWSPADVAPGRAWSIVSKGHVAVPDGTHELRVIKVRGDLGMTITPEVQGAA